MLSRWHFWWYSSVCLYSSEDLFVQEDKILEFGYQANQLEPNPNSVYRVNEAYFQENVNRIAVLETFAL